jgi:VIT1/CCC1 family predicted Fe2+/Mn2+ transporter
MSESGDRLPHQFDHKHSDVTGGWLRAATFGAMDGLVSNTALIAGVAASASAQTVVLGGAAGLLAGAFSMALGEYTSVTTANEQIDSEVRIEKRAFETHPGAERAELVEAFRQMGMTTETAVQATEELHRDESRALRFHLVQELGIDPTEKPSATVAASSSFLTFSIGAIIPLLPYLLGFESLTAGLLCGGTGLLVAGAMAAHFTKQSKWRGAARQLIFGMTAIAATYLVGHAIGTVV